MSAAAIAGAMRLPEEFVLTIRDAAPLHDIGKIGISHTILIKPRRADRAGAHPG